MQDEIGCTSCKSGYYTKNGICIQAGSWCKSVKNEFGCISCVSGYYAKNGNCVNPGSECLSM
jgi:hypothetical protein